MRVVEIVRPGGPEVLALVERPVPSPGPGEILLTVYAASVNRPDIQQRRGLYPPPPGVTDIPGLDAAGRVAAVGAGVDTLAVGDAVCALTNGGAYADQVVVPAVQCMPLPRGFSFIEAASLPEAFFTAWNNVIWLGRLADGETLLVQGGASGVGMAAIQMAKRLRGARVFATAGSEEKRSACLALGADAVFDYRGDWAAAIPRHAGEHCIDVALDAQAGPNVQRQLDLMAPDGRLVLIASHLGATADVNIRDLVRRRLTLTGSTLDAQSIAEAASTIEQRFGSLDSLVNSGGSTTPVPVADLDSLSDAIFDRTVAINLRGPFATISPAMIFNRARLETIEVDFHVYCRFHSRAVRESGDWKIASFHVFFERDVISPVYPSDALPLDRTVLEALRPSYRFLAYIQKSRGVEVDPSLFGDDRPDELAAFHTAEERWLAGEGAPVL